MMKHYIALTLLLTVAAALAASQPWSMSQYSQDSCSWSAGKPMWDCDDRYRSIDGFCNNPWEPFWGWAGDLYLRWEGVEFEDGWWWPVYRGNERDLSNTFFKADYTYPKRPLTLQEKIYGAHPHPTKLNNFHVIFGQFLTHDITWSPSEKRKWVLDKYAGVKIAVNPSDSLYNAQSGQYLSATPSEGAWIGKKFVPWNNNTAFIDASTVYGSTYAVSHSLRSHQGGKLKAAYGGGLPFNEKIGVPNDCDTQSYAGKGTNTHAAGDVRVDENVGITSIHSIWHAEHNRLCDMIAQSYPGMSDEDIYQEARRIVIAEMQHIVYDEYLPALLIDPYNAKNYQNIMNMLGQYDGYKPWVHPGITNAFSTAAFRFGHDLINLPPLVLDDYCNIVSGPEISYQGGSRIYSASVGASSTSQDSSATVKSTRYPVFSDDTETVSAQSYQARDYSMQPYNGEKIMCNAVHYSNIPGGDKSIIRGLVNQYAQKQDMMVTDYLRNINAGPWGMDIEALHIYRGRTHGLPNYDAVRVAYGMPSLYEYDGCKRGQNYDSLACFLAITSNQQIAYDLQRVYKWADNIDAVVGMLAEDIDPDYSQLPPLMTNIIIYQFRALRDGDRFWYENTYEGLYSADEVKQIKYTKFADIIRRNSGIDDLADDVFHVPSYSKCTSYNGNSYQNTNNYQTGSQSYSSY